MPDFEAIEVLTQAKERIMEHGWGQGTVDWRKMHRDDEESYCLEDGLCRERGRFVMNKWREPAIMAAAHYVKRALGLTYAEALNLWRWNDQPGRSAGEIFAALDDAILLAKDAPVQ